AAVGGTPTFTAPSAAALSIVVNGQDGADTLTLDFSNGAFAVAGGVAFNGGTGTDEITVSGSNAMSYVLGDTSLYAANSSTDFGTAALNSVEQAVLNGGPLADAFEFNGWTGTASVNGQGGANSLLVDGTAAADTVTVTRFGVSLNSASIAFSGTEGVS